MNQDPDRQDVSISVLILEDNPDDAALMLRELRKAGYRPSWRQVETGEAFLLELDKGCDLVLADYTLPRFSAPDALRLVRECGRDIPFIVVTGTIGEEQAVECMRLGAADYLLKDRLARLGQAVGRALGDRELRVERHKTAKALRESEERLRHLAFHDDLSGLPNRALFMELLERAVERARKDRNYRFAVLMIDLDRFKMVNDSLGHPAGDALLRETARRIAGCAGHEDVVSRLGGDEFGLLMDDIRSVLDPTHMAEAILAAVSAPVRLDGEEIFPSASIGVVLPTPAHDRADLLLRDADTALYRAKAEGKARFAMFDADMHSRAMEHLKIESDLRRAVERREFELHYQPIVALETMAVAGFEALVRWRHPTRGLVPPLEFIPLAEETGLILPIGDLVLHEACRQVSEWHSWKPGYRPKVSVNISALQFQEDELPDRISSVLAETGLPAECLILEVTESVVMTGAGDDAGGVARTVRRLKRLGVGLSIDDFGTGYSSLAYLPRLKADTLKIDRSFVLGLGRDDGNEEIVRAIVRLAHALSMDVVAEGVEDEDSAVWLKNLGCELAQGYWFSRPVPADEAWAVLRDGCARTLAGNSG